MADPVLKPLTALGHDAPETVTIGAVTIAERFDVALASLATRRGRQADVVQAAQASGIPLPPPARAEAGQTFGAFWLAADQWMIEAPFASHEDIVGHLKPLFGDAASITEQTDAWVRLDLAAPDLAPLFERLCNVDLGKAPEGFASRTVIEHMGCYLIRRAAGKITLYGPRSSAASLLHALKAAARAIA